MATLFPYERVQALYFLGHGLPANLIQSFKDKQQGIAYVGDVGTIRADTFVRAFNAFLPANHPDQGYTRYYQYPRVPRQELLKQILPNDLIIRGGPEKNQ